MLQGWLSVTIPSNGERERRIQERLETRLAARYERVLRRELSAAAVDAAKAYRESGLIESAVRAHDDRIEAALIRMWTDAYNLIGQRTERQISKATGKAYKQEMSEGFRRGLDLFIRRFAARKIRQISHTTSEQIAQTVRRGIEDGLSVVDLAGEIATHGRALAGYRANLIARTEVHSAAQAGSIEAAKDTGLRMMKNWVAVNDDRTRDGDNSDFDHTNVESVPLNEPFNVDGELLEYPGDPAGSAGNIIFCRCAVTYRVV